MPGTIPASRSRRPGHHPQSPAMISTQLHRTQPALHAPSQRKKTIVTQYPNTRFHFSLNLTSVLRLRLFLTKLTFPVRRGWPVEGGGRHLRIASGVTGSGSVLKSYRILVLKICPLKMSSVELRRDLRHLRAYVR